MNREKLDEKYNECGGFKKLLEMKIELKSLEEISKVFNVSKERIRQWMIELFGTNYDPRRDRRENRINFILDFIKQNGTKEAIKMFERTNKSYVQEAINRFMNNQ